MPSKSELLNWRTDHLGVAAKAWGDQASQLDSMVQDTRKTLGDLQGSGEAIETLRTKLREFVDTASPKVSKLSSAALVAESSERQLKDAKDRVLYDINDAENHEFNVNEDLTVTEKREHSGLDRLWRAFTRRQFEGNIRTRAQELVATDKAIARKLSEIAQDLSNLHLSGPDGTSDFSGGVLKPGEVKNLGPVMGTGAPIPGIGAADLGEVIEVPDGQGGTKLIAVFGDSYDADHFAQGEAGVPHYRSAAVEIRGFDENGKPIWGNVLTGPFMQVDDQHETKMPGLSELFPTTGLPQVAQDTFTLPAGSIVMNDGTTYMMVNGTKDLHSVGGDVVG